MSARAQFCTLSCAALLLLSAAATRNAAAQSGCESHGTAIDWAPDFTTAQQMARDQGKLLFVVHLSGNFAHSTFT